MKKRKDNRLQNGCTFLAELEFGSLSDYATNDRLIVFITYGTKCVACDRVGTKLIRSVDNGGGVHVDVFTDDMVLMTVDHIIPRKEKGGEHITNKQPMCTDCNCAKGHRIVTPEQMQIERNSQLMHLMTKYTNIVLHASTAPQITCQTAVFTSGGSARGPLTKKYAPYNGKVFKRKMKLNGKTKVKRLQYAQVL